MSALSDLLVLDCSRVLAGPFCGQLFAEQGATVIKVEPPGGGDFNRTWPTIVDGNPPGTSFLSVNKGKKSLTLNLKHPEGKKVLYDLVRKADIFIHNYLPETAEALEVDYETLSRLNDRLIWVSMTGYGAKGALSNKPGFDTLMTAYSGIMSITGEPDRPPVKPGISAIDLSTGMLAFAGALAAVHARDAGRATGQKVEVSLLETAVTLLNFHAVNWLVAGKLDEREGADYGPIVPFGRYACSDGDIMFGAPSNDVWMRLCNAIGAEDLKDHPVLGTPEGRRDNRKACGDALEAVLRRKSVDHWAHCLDRAGIANSPVRNIQQVLADPQVAANDMILDYRLADGRDVKLLGTPIKLSAATGPQPSPPPLLGEHTDSVLSDTLGLSTGEIARLKALGAV